MSMMINGGMNRFDGDIDTLDAHGGVYYLYGKVGNFVQHGGLVYDCRPANRIEYRTDRMSDEERWRFRKHISSLERKIKKQEQEIIELKVKTDNQKTDEYLQREIYTFKEKLKSQKAESEKQIDLLQERLDGALEVNAKLRKELEKKNKEGKERGQEIADNHIDILATVLCLYPYTADDDIVLEFGLPKEKVRFIARTLGVLKSSEARQEAREYLRKQGIELIERRGGDQRKSSAKTKKTK
jgi:hypothetical protein